MINVNVYIYRRNLDQHVRRSHAATGAQVSIVTVVAPAAIIIIIIIIIIIDLTSQIIYKNILV